MRRLFFLVLFAAIALLAFSPSSYGQSDSAEMLTEKWANNDGGFSKMSQQLEANNELNLLTFPGAKIHEATRISSSEYLVDGSAGVPRGEGRVQVDGFPSVITYYLGKPRPIQEIIVWTFNGDQRANQNFDVFLANNAENPGKAPKFGKKPDFTTGKKILGGNGGGFMTAFVDPQGKTLTAPGSDEKKYDWVQFKIYRTYKANAGADARKDPGSWTALVELQVLGDPNDPNLFASEEERRKWLARRAAMRLERRMKELGPDLVRAIKNPESLRLAIEDLARRFPETYTAEKTEQYLTKLESFEKRLADQMGQANMAKEDSVEKLLELAREYDAFRREVLLANPLMDFDQLLVRRGKQDGLMQNWLSNCARSKNRNYDTSIVTMNPRDSESGWETIAEGPQGSFIGDMCLHWDADRMLVTALAEDNTWQIFELTLDGQLTQVTPSMGHDVDNAEGCYVPDGAVLFTSTASMLGVPCIGGGSVVGNLYRLEPDGETIRQLTFEQDQDWCPVTLHNGRIMYLRWEYTDTPHYFTRILFHMNPDGTNQIEYYGSGSYWPNSLFYARPVPGHPTKFAGIVSGHHGTKRAGELVVFDPKKGRKEANGVVQRIPGHGEEVEPIIVDRLVDPVWPKFLFPQPLNENYYLVSAKLTSDSPWCIYLVDVFDNFVLLKEDPGYGLFEPTPLVERETPPVIPSRIDPEDDEATVFITDIYMGDGLKDVPKGTVKKLRIFSYSFGYRNIGGHALYGMESCWDGRRILGEVPVREDGSAMFKIPANLPVSLQPLDEKGRALQLMRSWIVGMPGERLSCVGCHEHQNTVTPAKSVEAAFGMPDQIEPFYGEPRAVAYESETQPILDKYCVGCHDGEKPERPNFADTSAGPRGFSQSYHALHRYVRRPGPESDIYMFQPLEYHASTSPLFQMLQKGHHNVRLDGESMEKLYMWTDLNVPYFGTWTEIAQSKGQKVKLGDAPINKISDRFVELRDMYANIDLDFEQDAFLGKKGERPEFVKPPKLPELDDSAPEVDGWPFSTEKARAMQKSGEGPAIESLALTDEIRLDLARIPAGTFIMGDRGGCRDELPRVPVTIDEPFRMGTTEVTNELYGLFDPEHDSRFIDQQWKDHTTPGYPANLPKQPVIRVSWNEANEFCRWLSRKTGRTFRLPTEAEWEWACRAGADTPMWFGGLDADFGTKANLADTTITKFVVKGVNPRPVNHEPWQAFIPRTDQSNDGAMIAIDVGSYEPNPWGLMEMHGSVAEWTASDYAPYPYANDGRNAPDTGNRKVVRGGSWRDVPDRARAGFRLKYQPWQKVFNVGFRVVCED